MVFVFSARVHLDGLKNAQSPRRRGGYPLVSEHLCFFRFICESEIIMTDRLPTSRPVVLSFNASILTHEAEMQTVVAEVRRFVLLGRPTLVVVGGLWGSCKRLGDSAAKVSARPDEPALARLLNTGEQASAALLSLALSDNGIDHALADARSIRFVAQGPATAADPIAVDAGALAGLLDRRRVVVLAGGEAIDPRGQSVSLGRDGADLAAIFIAAQIDADARLVRDTDGISEPSDSRSGASAPRERVYRSLAWDLASSVAGGQVSTRALRYASRVGLPFRVVAPGSDIGTLISGTTELDQLRVMPARTFSDAVSAVA